VLCCCLSKAVGLRSVAVLCVCRRAACMLRAATRIVHRGGGGSERSMKQCNYVIVC